LKLSHHRCSQVLIESPRQNDSSTLAIDLDCRCVDISLQDIEERAQLFFIVLVGARSITRYKYSAMPLMLAVPLVQSVSACNDQLSNAQSDVPSMLARRKTKGDIWTGTCESKRRENFGYRYENECGEENKHSRNIHGIIMAIVVLILFPVGALSMRLLGRWWLHAGFQVLSLLLLVAGFGIGVYLAKTGHKVQDLLPCLEVETDESP